MICPACQQLARFQRWQSKNFLSALGDVRVQRAYYDCRHCGHAHHPWEGVLGLTAQDLTPAAGELTSLAGLVCSFDARIAARLKMSNHGRQAPRSNAKSCSRWCRQPSALWPVGFWSDPNGGIGMGFAVGLAIGVGLVAVKYLRDRKT